MEPHSAASPSWSAATQENIAAGEYAPQADGNGFRATNRAQDLHASFGPGGLTVTGRSGTGEVALTLRAWGREDRVTAADAIAPEEGACLYDGAVDAFGDCLRRVHYARPGLTEWWENRPEGLEQGFTVTAAPDGDGALVFDLAVTGALADVEGDEALLVRETGDPLRFGGLAAWDATGRSLPAWMEESDSGLRILVDDSGAIGAVTVDPLLTTASWTSEGDQASAEFGYAVASAGDVNGDGYGDVIIGAQRYDNGETNEGRAYVYLGSASGLGATAAWTAESNQAFAEFGHSVASAGDVNGDGYGDVVIGAEGYDNGSADEGRAFLYLGSAAGLAASPAWTAESDQASALFGISVGSAGDVNADGYADVIVGAWAYDNGQTDEGRAYMYLGSASGLSTTAAWTAEGDQSGANFAVSVASAGDMNGDGYGDVVVGAYRYDTRVSDEGRVFVYFGSAAGLSAPAGPMAESDQDSAYFGILVGSAGDVNGDGYGDLVVGAYGYDNGQTDEGRAFVYLGSATGFSNLAPWTAESDQAGGNLGISVASAGDVNGDGFGDLVVGAYAWDNGQSNEGRVAVYLGSSSGLAASAAWTRESDQDGAYLGQAVASAGDVNGDGYGDVLVAAHFYDNGQTDEGRAFLYLGAASGLATSAGWTGEADQENSNLGYSVASAGDVNGDGYGDVVVGAPLYDVQTPSSDDGKAFVFLGYAYPVSYSDLNP